MRANSSEIFIYSYNLYRKFSSNCILEIRYDGLIIYIHEDDDDDFLTNNRVRKHNLYFECFEHDMLNESDFRHFSSRFYCSFFCDDLFFFLSFSHLFLRQ